MGPVFYVVAALFFVGLGAFLEHLRPQPKLNTEELFLAFDLIDVECETCPKEHVCALTKDDYDRVRELRSELYVWMESAKMSTVSLELQGVLDKVLDIDRTNFD